MLVQRLGAPSDFDPLLERVRDARIVMIGEATHGSYDYYRLREQLTRRLIAEQGFYFVAVEGDWPDCDRVHRSVVGRAGRRRPTRRPPWSASSAGRPGCGPTPRWPGSASWLRAWNLERPEGERAGFHGLDVYSLWESMQAIFDYLGEEDPASLEAAQEAYRCFEPYGKRVEEYGAASRFVSARCEEEVVRLLARTREQAAADGPDRFSAWQNAEVVAGAERYYRAMVGGGPESWNVRDIHMADTLDRLLDRYGPDARGIVWAHNTHVGDARATDMAADGMVNIGQLARERHGRDAVALVGFGSYRGNVIAAPRWGSPAEAMVVPPAREGSVERRLHELMPERAVLVFGGADQPELGHRAGRPPGDRGGLRPDLRVLGQLRADPARRALRRASSGATRPPPCTRCRRLTAPGEMETYPAGV